MLALLAFLPILTTLILMMVFNWPAKRCLLISWLMAPKHSNPNLLPIGETFGFVVFLKDVK